MSMWLVLDKFSGGEGYALQLYPAPVKWGGIPRPYSIHGDNQKFNDFKLYWVRSHPMDDEEDNELKYRITLNRQDELCESAYRCARLAYNLCYEQKVEHFKLGSYDLRFQLLESEALAQNTSKAITGKSGDLLFALAFITATIKKEYLPIAATGELDSEGRVQSVQGVNAKLKAYLSALENHQKTEVSKSDYIEADIKALFFYPRPNHNDLDHILCQTAVQAGVRLIAVERLEEAITSLGIRLNNFWQGNPFRGLATFNVEHSRVFFGRDDIKRELRIKLQALARQGKPGIIITGSSGRGKSSLVQAGLLHELLSHKSMQERPIFYHIWRFPQDYDKSETALANAIRLAWSRLPELGFKITIPKTHNDQKLKLDNLSGAFSELLTELATVLPKERRFVWVIDQLEDLFALGFTKPVQDAFGEFLKQLQQMGVWTITTLRSEYLHEYQASNLLAVFGDGKILPKLDKHQLREIIRKPAEMAKLEFEIDRMTNRDLAEQILDDSLQQSNTDGDILPLLEFTLSKLYEDAEHRKRNDGILTWVAYAKRIGGLEGAINKHAEEILAKCIDEERKVLPEVLFKLMRLSEDGTQAICQPTLIDAFSGNEYQKNLVNKLIEGRLLVSNHNEQNKKPYIVFAHCRLIILWIAARNTFNQYHELFQRRQKLSVAAKNWHLLKDPKLLLQDKELTEACVLLDFFERNTINYNYDDRFIQSSIKFSFLKRLIKHICSFGFGMFLLYGNSILFQNTVYYFKSTQSIPDNVLNIFFIFLNSIFVLDLVKMMPCFQKISIDSFLNIQSIDIVLQDFIPGSFLLLYTLSLTLIYTGLRDYDTALIGFLMLIGFYFLLKRKLSYRYKIISRNKYKNSINSIFIKSDRENLIFKFKEIYLKMVILLGWPLIFYLLVFISAMIFDYICALKLKN